MFHASFDYIVVGSGPAGCAFARALFEQTEHLGEEAPSIAILEEAAEVDAHHLH